MEWKPLKYKNIYDFKQEQQSFSWCNAELLIICSESAQNTWKIF